MTTRVRPVVLIVVIGAVLRLLRFFDCPSLWHDEAFVAMNVIQRSFGGLLEPLADHQVAPPVWLFLEKGAVTMFGTSELALRLVPLLSSLAALALVSLVALRLLAGRAAIVAVLMLATSPSLLDQATIMKPYSSDVLAAAALLLAAPGTNAGALRAWSLWSLLAMPCLFLSYPSIFVSGGILLAHAIAARGAWTRALLAIAPAATALSVGLVLLLGIPSSSPDDPALREYWASGFPPGGVLPFLGWLGGSVLSIADEALPNLGLLVLPMVLLGTFFLRRRAPEEQLRLTFPFLLLFLASLLGRYPMEGGRLTLFLVPALILLAAEGVVRLLESSRTDASRLACHFLLGSLVLVPMAAALWKVVVPAPRHNLRPLLTRLLPDLEPGDVIVSACARAELEYYWTVRGLGRSDVTVLHDAEGVEYLRRRESGAGSTGRLWLLTTTSEERLERLAEGLYSRAEERGGETIAIGSTRAIRIEPRGGT